MSAIDILGNLNGFNVNSLEPFQRILLVTDGTLTEILEAMVLERIRLVKVSQAVIPATASHALLDPNPQDPLIERKILLQGVESQRHYVYAESLIAVDRLSQSFRDELINSGIPLGRLWLEHKLETFKELHGVGCQPAKELCRYFDCADTAPLLVRTYQVWSASKPVMVITEYFPAVYQCPAENAGRKLDQLVDASL
jgi:chorismate-pyruvate lyase